MENEPTENFLSLRNSSVNSAFDAFRRAIYQATGKTIIFPLDTLDYISTYVVGSFVPALLSSADFSLVITRMLQF